jgi:hypothetical protein
MICRSERRRQLPTLRLRAGGGQLVCLLRAPSSTTDQNGARVLAFIASWRAPFLRRFRLYGQRAVPSPHSTPSAA